MKKAIIFVIIVIVVFNVLKFQGVFDSPVQKMVKRVEQADIVSYELEWLVKQEGKETYISIDKEDDPTIINAIKQSMDNIVPYSELSRSYIWLKPLGILRLRARDGSQERIDIAKSCFFVGGDRRDNAAFYSVELSGIMEKIFFKALKENEQLLAAKDLFEALAEGGDLKYIFEPGVKEGVVEKIEAAQQELKNRLSQQK